MIPFERILTVVMAIKTLLRTPSRYITASQWITKIYQNITKNHLTKKIIKISLSTPSLCFLSFFFLSLSLSLSLPSFLSPPSYLSLLPLPVFSSFVNVTSQYFCLFHCPVPTSHFIYSFIYRVLRLYPFITIYTQTLDCKT